MTTTRIDYGNALLTPGQRQPSGTITEDAFGVIQAQLTFALDSDPSNVKAALIYYSAGVAYPDDLGFPLKSYKCHVSSAKGGVSMLTVDYMGIGRLSGYTDAQITGVANTTAQPIETHPNFTKVTDTTIGTGSTTQLLAGKGATPVTNGNLPIFNQVQNTNGSPAYQFIGFGCPNDDTVNPKAGIRQFLRPMWNVRGVIFFSDSTSTSATNMTKGVGRTLHGFGDVNKLIVPDDVFGYVEPAQCLLTNASVECIGKPSNFAALKVTYDIMIGGELGWDPDIYGKADTAIF